MHAPEHIASNPQIAISASLFKFPEMNLGTENISTSTSLEGKKFCITGKLQKFANRDALVADAKTKAEAKSEAETKLKDAKKCLEKAQATYDSAVDTYKKLSDAEKAKTEAEKKAEEAKKSAKSGKISYSSKSLNPDTSDPANIAYMTYAMIGSLGLAGYAVSKRKRK